MSSSTAQDVAFPQPLTAEGTPDPLLLAAATESPVLRVVGPGGSGAWLVAGEQAVREVLSDPDRFTSVPPANLSDERAYAVPLVGMDPPEHTRMRRLAAKAFTARRIASLTPTIERLTHGLLDEMATSTPPVDLVSALAYPLPLDVIFGILGGIPTEVRHDLRRWTDIFTSLDSNSFESIAEAVDGFHTCMRELIADRRTALGDDLMSDLIRARDDRDALNEDELVGVIGLLVVAGYETTAKVITRGVLSLLHYGHWERLVSGDLPVDAAVEEVLRHQSPNTAICRTAKVDTEFYGMPIRQGDAVYVSTHLANYDGATREDPSRFDPTRADSGHTTFGYGVHFCLGAALARTELTIVLTTLAQRFPSLHLHASLDDLEWTVGSWLNSPTTLPVAW